MCVKGHVYLHCAQDNTHKLEVTIDLPLMPREFVDATLNALEGLDVAKVSLFWCSVEQGSPVVHCKTFDCKAKLECCVRKRRRVLAFGACRQPGDPLAEMVR